MNAFQLILHMCWGLGFICSRKWFEWLCEICQGNKLGTTGGAVKCNHVLARQQGLLWHGMQKGSSTQIRSEDSRGSSERFNSSTHGEAVSADESVKGRLKAGCYMACFVCCYGEHPRSQYLALEKNIWVGFYQKKRSFFCWGPEVALEPYPGHLSSLQQRGGLSFSVLG